MNNSIESRPEIEWVNIPAGTFMMGSPIFEVDRNDEEIQHEVTLSAFRMSKYAITFDQFDPFCEAMWIVKPHDEGWGRGNRPVINVHWDMVIGFAKWMGCRLPTEAEWEYACRAGTTTPFHTGFNLTTSQANFHGLCPYDGHPAGEFRDRTMPVGSFPPNAWGLYDMHGNVKECCSDWFGDYLPQSQKNPRGPRSGPMRVIRGGGYHTHTLAVQHIVKHSPAHIELLGFGWCRQNSPDPVPYPF